jgi:putative endonuclease
MRTQDIGQRGETLARGYLEKQGFEFITANWRCKAGEIDLIMKTPSNSPLSGGEKNTSLPDKGGSGWVLVFVEVRMRRPTSFGAGYETVAWQKQKKLLRAGRWYMQATRWRGDARFDVVSIINFGTRQEIEHIPNAFSAGY